MSDGDLEFTVNRLMFLFSDARSLIKKSLLIKKSYEIQRIYDEKP